MPLTKVQKQMIIADLKDKIAKQKVIILVGIAGLKVKDISELRKKLKTAEGNLKVAKKTLMGMALKDYYPPTALQPKPTHPKKETPIAQKIKELEGEIALVFGFEDIILPAKTIWQFSTNHPNLKILGGVLENAFVGPEKIVELAQLPGKNELLIRLVGSISAPISNFVNVLQGNIKGLIYVLSAIKK